MNWLYEQPLIIAVLGLMLVLGLGAAWSSSGRKELLYAMAAAVVLLIAGLVIERLVITDREAIRATILQIARDVQNNDRHAVLRHIHSKAADLRRRAEAELPNYRFTECRITKIHDIDVDRHTEPTSAIAKFNGIFSVSSTKEGADVNHYPQWFKLQMLREKDGRWTIVDFEHREATQMLRNESTE